METRAKPPPASKMPPKGTGRSNIFQTKDSKLAIGCIAPYIPKHWKIWECAAGQGRLVAELKGRGYEVTASDIETGFDFLDTLMPVPKCDMLLTNPPFDVKDRWIRRCYDIGKPWALLMPITAHGEQERVSMYREYGVQLIMPPRRIEFITPNGTEGGGWFFSVWFTWGLNLPRDNVYPTEKEAA
jgi:hypothetical protein